MKLKRLLSMVLCLGMVLSCFPVVSVFAETETATQATSVEQTVRIEAENAAWNIYADPASANENASGTMVGGAPGTPTYPSWDDADSTEDLVNGFIDKSNDPYVVFYVDAPAAGTYKLKTAGLFRLNTANDNAYAAILVNPSRKIEDPSATVAYKAYYGAVGTAGVYEDTDAVEVQLVEGRNVIFVTPLTYEQDVKWANVDYLDITGAYAVEQASVNVQTLYAGDAPYTYGYTTKNAGGSIGGGNWGGLGSKTLAIADMSAANADKLRSFAYTVNAPEDGYYDITVSFNSMTANDDAKAIGFLVDGAAQAREFVFNQAANAKGVNRNKGYIDISVYLTEGDHVLSITAPANRTSAETANNSDWCDYAELVLHGGLVQSVIQSNPKMEWWYAEAEYVEQGYAVTHNLPNVETGHNNTYRDYNNANYGAYQSKCAMGGGSAATNYTLAQLQEGRLDKATTTGVSIYVEAEEAGSYDFYAYYRFNCPGVYDHPTREGHIVIGEEVALAISGVATSRLEAETHSVYWRYTAIEAGATNNAVGGVQPGTVANMLSYEALTGGTELKKTENPMMSFVVDVPAEGDYTLDVAYRAGFKTGTINDYYMVVGVDDAAYTKTSYMSAHPDNSKWSLGQATVHLTEGRHVIRFITMVSETVSDSLYTNWVNIDYVDVTGAAKVTPVEADWTHLQSGEATYYNKFTNPGDTSIDPATYGEWYTSVLGGYQGDSSVSNNGITVDNFNIYELAKLGYFSYTVEVPADGFYDLQTYIRCYKDYTKQRTGHIMLAVDDQVNWYPAEWGYSVLKWNAQNLSVYLTEGTHVLTVSGIIGDLGTCSADWCDMGALSVSGGITLAETQIDPLSLIAKVDEIYVDAVNGKDIYAGTEAAPVATLAKAFERINDGGTIHLVGTVPGTKGLPKFNGTVTITGGTLDLSAFEKVWMNSGIIFDTVTLNFMEDGHLFANGYYLTINENVTVQNHISLYGGNYNADVANTEMYIYTGDYNVIYGGGYWSDISGTAKLTVGGNVNQGWGESTVLDHDSGIDIFGGSYDAIVNKTEVTFEGNAVARMVYAGGKNGVSVTNETNITVTGGKAVAIYGAGASGSSVGNTNVVMTGGYIEQVYGGAETANVTGNVTVQILGGEITRRLGGGSYNGDVTGTVSLYLSEGMTYSRSYDGYGFDVSEDITARCRTGSTGGAYLYFITPAAYDKFYGNTNELADDPADNFPPERPVFAIYTGEIFIQGFDTLEEAMTACDETSYIKLAESATTETTLSKDLYIDLNGYSLNGTITAGDFKVYGMDSTTDKYAVATGSFNCGVTPVKEFKTELTGEIRRYMAV